MLLCILSRGQGCYWLSPCPFLHREPSVVILGCTNLVKPRAAPRSAADHAVQQRCGATLEVGSAPQSSAAAAASAPSGTAPRRAARRASGGAGAARRRRPGRPRAGAASPRARAATGRRCSRLRHSGRSLATLARRRAVVSRGPPEYSTWSTCREISPCASRSRTCTGSSSAPDGSAASDATRSKRLREADDHERSGRWSSR